MGPGVYYAATFVLGPVCWRFPRCAPWIGTGESAANLVILMVAVLLPIWTAPDALLAGGGFEGRALLLERVVNLVLGGAVMVWSFYGYQAEMSPGPRRRGATMTVL